MESKAFPVNVRHTALNLASVQASLSANIQVKSKGFILCSSASKTELCNLNRNHF